MWAYDGATPVAPV